MTGRALLFRLVIALLRVANKAGGPHRTDRRPALGLMASRSGTPRGMQGASVRLAGGRVTCGAVPFVRVVFAVARRTSAFDRSLPRISMTTGAFEARVLGVREAERSGSRLRPHGEGKRRSDGSRRPYLTRGMARCTLPSGRRIAVVTALAIARYRDLQVPVSGARTMARGAGDRRVSGMFKACGIAPLHRA